MMESGIKVLDMFAPLVRGGTIGLVARTNVGQLVTAPFTSFNAIL